MENNTVNREVQFTEYTIPGSARECLDAAGEALFLKETATGAVLVEAAKVRAYQERTDGIVGIFSTLMNEALGHFGSWAVQKSASIQAAAEAEAAFAADLARASAHAAARAEAAYAAAAAAEPAPEPPATE